MPRVLRGGRRTGCDPGDQVFQYVQLARAEVGEAFGRLAQDPLHAADRLLASKAARDLFGDVFVEHYAMSRHWEEREYRRAITDWELARYFEII